jgi:hypothetical protein
LKGAQCKSKEEIEFMSFSLAKPEVNLNLKNYKKPIEYVSEADEYFYISAGLNTKHRVNLMKATIADENGFLSPQSEGFSFSTVRNRATVVALRDPSQITCTEDMLPSGVCNTYYRLQYFNTYSKQEITREYKGVVETISDIGGMIELIFLVFCPIYSIYHSFAQESFLMDRIYGLKKPSFKRDKGVRPGEQEPSIDARRKQYRAAKENLDRHFDFLSLVRELNQLKLLLASTDQAKQSLSDREVALHLLQQEPDLPKPLEGQTNTIISKKFTSKRRVIREISGNGQKSDFVNTIQEKSKPVTDNVWKVSSKNESDTSMVPPIFDHWDEKSLDPLHPQSQIQN